MNVSSITDLKIAIDDIEGTYLVDHLTTILRHACPHGCFIIPLLGHGEVFMGMVIVTGIDKLPTCTYGTGSPITAAIATTGAPL